MIMFLNQHINGITTGMTVDGTLQSIVKKKVNQNFEKK